MYVMVRCKNCGKENRVHEYTVDQGEGLFCDRSCVSSYRRKPSVIKARFWSYVAIGGEDDCWPYIGAVTSKGYGSFTFYLKNKRVSMVSSRFAWTATFGVISKSVEVCHNCPSGDNPVCCNPKHLFLGTHKDNMQDMQRKNRRIPSQGVNHYRATLSDDDVREIIHMSKIGHEQRFIAKVFNKSQATIWAIIHRKIWKSVEL